MDIQDVRRRNLHQLIAQYDGPTALARKLQHNGTSYISQLSKGRRPVSEKTARQIEKQLRLPGGWFDQESPDRAAAVAPIEIDRDRFTDTITRVAETLRSLGKELPPAKFAEVVAYVYQESVKGTNVDVAAVVRLVTK